MEMKVIKSEKGLCTCCMEEHEVKTVLIKERTIFKNVNVNYDAIYLYCDLADELYANEDQLQENDIHLKDAYRKMEGLLTSKENSRYTCKIRYQSKRFMYSFRLGTEDGYPI